MTQEEKELLEYTKAGNNTLGVATQQFEANTPLETKIKSGLSAINKGADIAINVIETKDVYEKTGSKKRALAKFTSNVFAGTVTAVIIGSAVSSGQVELVVIAFIANDTIQQKSESFLNALFDYIESKLPKQQGIYSNPIEMMHGGVYQIMNGAINRALNGF